jgi:hypothetical protein
LVLEVQAQIGINAQLTRISKAANLIERSSALLNPGMKSSDPLTLREASYKILI